MSRDRATVRTWRTAGHYRAAAMAGGAVMSGARVTNLTPAARRDLARIQAGEHPELRYGPYMQLLTAGYIVGTQDNYRPVTR